MFYGLIKVTDSSRYQRIGDIRHEQTESNIDLAQNNTKQIFSTPHTPNIK